MKATTSYVATYIYFKEYFIRVMVIKRIQVFISIYRSKKTDKSLTYLIIHFTEFQEFNSIIKNYINSSILKNNHID